MKTMTPRLYEAILDKVRDKLQSNKLTQEQIGDALGIKQSAVSYLLKGKTKLSLEQFLELTELVGERPQQIIAEAESGLTEKKPMPIEKEAILGKSLIHFICYCSSVKQIKPEDLASPNFPLEQVKVALEDLTKVGILDRRADGSYIQKHINIVYTAPTAKDRDRRNRFHLDLHRISQEVWHKQSDNKAYRASRFNYLLIDHFTPSQVREVEEFLWRACEKLRAYQRQNMANGYSSTTERYSLWQAHMMLMTPLEEK